MTNTPEYISEEEYQDYKRFHTALPLVFKKNKKLFWSYKSLKAFAEPAGLLIRIGGNIDFYEKLRGDEFKFEHSNTKKCVIHLHERFLKDISYGRTTFKCYIMHEDSAYPLSGPEDWVGTMNSELTEMLLQKVFVEKSKLDLEAQKAEAKKWFAILGGIGVIILCAAVYKMIAGNPAAAVAVAQNITNITNATMNTTAQVVQLG